MQIKLRLPGVADRGSIVYVIDSDGGATPALGVYDGTSWKRNIFNYFLILYYNNNYNKIMTSEPPKTYDCEAFIKYLPNISTTKGFLADILRELKDKTNRSLVKGMIGILTDSNGEDLPPDLTLLYDNWGPTDYRTYIDIISEAFLTDPSIDYEEALNNLAQFSGFLLNFYFLF